MQENLASCLSQLPDGITAEYEILDGVVTWRLTEKPVGLTLAEEKQILHDLHQTSDVNEPKKLK